MNQEILNKLAQNKAINVALLNADFSRTGYKRTFVPASNPVVVDDGAIKATKPDIKGAEGWAERISEWLGRNFVPSFSTIEILSDCLGVAESSKAEQMQVSQILTGLGYAKARATVRGVRDYYWTKVG